MHPMSAVSHSPLYGPLLCTPTPNVALTGTACGLFGTFIGLRNSIHGQISVFMCKPTIRQANRLHCACLPSPTCALLDLIVPPVFLPAQTCGALGSFCTCSLLDAHLSPSATLVRPSRTSWMDAMRCPHMSPRAVGTSLLPCWWLT